MKIHYRKFIVAAALALVSVAAFAQTREVSLRPGESTDLHSVYWVSNCKSVLRKFAGIDVLEGSPGIQLSIREEMVTARRQNCPEKVLGGTVVLTAGSQLEKGVATIKYRVNYDTEDGRKQSNHAVQVSLYP